MGRIVVGVMPSLAGYEALRYGVMEARRRSAPLVAVRAFRSTSSGLGAQWNDVLRDSCRSDVSQVFDTALGGVPEDLNVQVAITEGRPGEVLTELANSPGDIIVIGGSMRRWRGGKVARYCARHAQCPVVVVPMPAFARTCSAHRLARRAVDPAEKLLASSSG
jgi:nucleotide-binding universal stress UspA family protein